MTSKRYDLIHHLVAFAKQLRLDGFLSGHSEVRDSVRILFDYGLMDQESTYWVLRAAFVTRPDEISVFDRQFRRFWSFYADAGILENSEDRVQSKLFTGGKNFRRKIIHEVAKSNVDHQEDVKVYPLMNLASEYEVNRERDLAQTLRDDHFDLREIAERVVRLLSDRPGRRFVPSYSSKGRIDLKKLMSRNAGMEEPLFLPRKRRKLNTPNIVMMLDVSGSMDNYVELLLRLAYEIRKRSKRIKVFIFSTVLSDITNELGAATYEQAIAIISERVTHWSGGTKIGACLYKLRKTLKNEIDRHSTLLLMSDGWDTGEPRDVAMELRSIKRKAKKIMWLNPLLGTDGYEQSTRSLVAAFGAVDTFVPARNISDLSKLPEFISR